MLIIVENFVLFSMLFSLAGFVIACAARRAAASGLWRPRPLTLSGVYTVTLVAPPVIAAWLVAAAFLPRLWLGEAFIDEAHPSPFDNLHLLSGLTARLEPTLVYSALLFIVLSALFTAWSSLRSYRRVGGIIKRLEMNATIPAPEQLALVEATAARYGLDVGLVMSDYPFSFVWGYRNSKLILSSGLLCSLSLIELEGVLEHEATHHARRDNMVKLFLSLCSYASVVIPLSRMVMKWRSLEVEMICDEVAVARTSAPLEIAESLVKLHRKSLSQKWCTPAGASASSFVSDDTASFSRRVQRAISFADHLPDPAQAAAMSQSPRTGALVFASTLVLTLVALSLLSPLAVHRTVESFIQITII